MNNHMTWLRGIFGYCDKSDPDRMNANLVVSDLDLPEMTLLTKDHKSWSSESGKAVPTRPVVSGNSTINTHLSEMLSEIIEPIALEANGAEIQSSEEALHLIDWMNEKTLSGRMDEYNYLDKFYKHEPSICNPAPRLPQNESTVSQHDAYADRMEHINNFVSDKNKNHEKIIEKEDCANEMSREDLHGSFGGTDYQNIHGGELLEPCGAVEQSTDQQELKAVQNENEEENDLFECLIQLCREGEGKRMEEDKSCCESKVDSENVWHQAVEAIDSGCHQKKISDYFHKTNETSGPISAASWKKTLESSERKSFFSESASLNNKIGNGMRAGDLWFVSNEIQDEEAVFQPTDSNRCLQMADQTPIMVGCDVVGLYPNLDPVNVAKITGEAVRKTKIKFNGVNFHILTIYLMLILGASHMNKLGLGEILPKRKNKKEENIRSLASKDINNWEFPDVKLEDGNKSRLLCIVIQIMVLLMTLTTC